ncbi:MAG: glycosyltransferase [Proteobacteria bacterium]|nr:glycosyltransferase [Pseudomonadota bacterium]
MINIDPALVSILIRSMDRPTLARALRSAAEQTWPNLEIVVVAACGAAHRPLGNSFAGRPLRLIYPQPDRRLPRPDAANLALESAQGEWLNFLDDDDELLPEHIAALMSAPRVDERVIYARSEVRDEAGKVTGHCGFEGFPIRFYYETLMTPNATAFHRSLVAEGARFDAQFPVYEDHDFFINCASRTRLKFVDAVTCVWNAHDGESGLGHGANRGIMRRAELSDALRRKWAAQFERWAGEPGALLSTGQSFLKIGNFEAARDCLERALTLSPADINALNLCGMANFHSGNLERAESLVGRALRQLPAHRALQQNLALIRARRAAGQ